jgi:hypothetical protein
MIPWFFCAVFSFLALATTVKDASAMEFAVSSVERTA